MVGEKIKQGDIIKININPTRGHEQAGYRPVVVINNVSHSRASNMTIVCPITNTDRQNPLHVNLSESGTTSFIMCDQIRSIDIRAREYKVTGAIDDKTLWEVCDIVQGLVDVES